MTSNDIIELNNLLRGLHWAIDDLDRFSVNHDDVANEELGKMKNLCLCVEEIMKREVKK